MPDKLIRKSAAGLHRPPNMSNVERLRATFSWDQVRDELLGASTGDINIARLAVDRQASSLHAGQAALRFIATDDSVRTLSYQDLRSATNRFANALLGLGLRQGDHVFVLASRCAPLYVAVLGALKAGCVVTPLFSAFGPEPIATRMRLGRAKLLLTTSMLYQRKIAQLRATLPTLEHVIVVNEDSQTTSSTPPDTLDYAELLAAASEDDPGVRTRAEDPALLHFTSGTTGTPKGAIHVHEAVLMHFATGRYALDLQVDDIFWCTADPGWVTGTSYGIIAPLLHGVTSVVDEGEFDAQRWYRILQRHQVSVWYTAPTALRMLMKAGTALAREHPCPDLRFIASVGEPLNPQAVCWGIEAFDLPVHDNWWQTETGGIMIANTAAMDIKPGAMGKPLPGVEALVVKHIGKTEDGQPQVEPINTPDVEGELALRVGWPAMFRGYLDQDERYRRCFAGDLYLSGDLAKVDADGYYWFIGRADDVIKSAGHLIGPFEVESVLMEHPAVAEVGVIGKPDAMVGEVVKAFVSLKNGVAESEALRSELLAHARKRLGAAVAPKEIAFAQHLPHTRSGKIMRRLLKARELGLPEGDTSTLEGASS